MSMRFFSTTYSDFFFFFYFFFFFFYFFFFIRPWRGVYSLCERWPGNDPSDNAVYYDTTGNLAHMC